MVDKKTLEFAEKLSGDFIKVERRIHKGWKEMENFKQKDPEGYNKLEFAKDLFGKYQYIFSSKKGEISLVHIKVGSIPVKDMMWEIFCLKGNLFEDVERFNTMAQGKAAAREYLKWKQNT